MVKKKFSKNNLNMYVNININGVVVCCPTKRINKRIKSELTKTKKNRKHNENAFFSSIQRNITSKINNIVKIYEHANF